MSDLLAIYGGAFDPVHEGHLAVARTARDTLQADIALIPTGDPRHRAPAHANASQRITMLQLAIANEPGLHIDTREITRSGPSYSVDTLQSLRHEHGPDIALAMIVGDDAFAGLHRWHRWQELFHLAHIIIASRPQPAALPPELQQQLQQRQTHQPAALRQQPVGLIYRLKLPLHPQSSSAIRARIAANQPLHGWLPDSVAAHITTHRLYRPGV